MAYEAHGLPAIVVVLDVLSDIAHATAAASGADELVIVPLHAVLFGQTREGIAGLATAAAQQAVAALTTG